ncbi:MAG: hypothetical protein ABJC10_05200 [Acidobacteriota bacterium]
MTVATLPASRPDIAVIGTFCNGIDATGRVVRPRDRWRLLRRSAYIPFPPGGGWDGRYRHHPCAPQLELAPLL